MILANVMHCVHLITIHSSRENHGIKITMLIVADNEARMLFITKYSCFLWYRRILATTNVLYFRLFSNI